MPNKIIPTPSDAISIIKFIVGTKNIDTRYLKYAVELLGAVTSENATHNWLYSVENYSDTKPTSSATIIKLLDIFDNIIDVNCSVELKPENINRLMSQLTNIINLSRAPDHKTISNIKYIISTIKDEQLSSTHIPSGGYSQEGEDLILKRLFPTDKKGFFVDVGAHHPTRFSNTYLLYKMGWRGINIDPKPGGMKLFNEIRPDDINLEYAIGDAQSKNMTANYISYKEPAYNSIYIGNKENIKTSVDSEILKISEVRTRTLDDVLDEHADKFDSINLLSIDVEGFETQVLNGFSIDKYRPDIIVIESRGFDIDSCNEIDEYKYIIENGYKLRSFLYHSLIFERIKKLES